MPSREIHEPDLIEPSADCLEWAQVKSAEMNALMRSGFHRSEAFQIVLKNTALFSVTEQTVIHHNCTEE